jgi:hypothetical protein
MGDRSSGGWRFWGGLLGAILGSLQAGRFAFAFKERSEKVRRLIGANPFRVFDLMVGSRMVQNLAQGYTTSEFFVPRSPNNPFYPGMDEGASTHEAGLHGTVHHRAR